MILFEIGGELTKKALAAVGAASLAYGAKKSIDMGEEELFKRNYEYMNQHRSLLSKTLGNLTHGMVGTSDEELMSKAKLRAKEAGLTTKFSIGAKKLIKSLASDSKQPNPYGFTWNIGRLTLG